TREAIRLFLAYASYMGFMVYLMDVKSAFLYETIKKEVYVCQPLVFEDHDYPNKVYKVIKVLYGLHQAPRAWYETLANYLLENGFQRGKIDQTLFIKKQKGDILLVQVYIDDIIFGSTNKELCKAFEKLIKDKFQMTSMGELTFFLGLQVKQKQDGIFISQDKYVAKILRKFGLTDRKLASTPIDTEKPLLKDPDGEDVNVHTYRPMISSLMYLTSSRPDIMFAVYACAHFHVTPKLHIYKQSREFRHLKDKPHLGLWYLKDSPFNLVAYLDSDYAGASLDRKSTIGGCQLLGCRLTSWQCKKQTVVATSSAKAEYVAAASCYAQVLWIQNKKVLITEDTVSQALHLDDAESIDCLPNEEIFAELARMGYEKPFTKLPFYKDFSRLNGNANKDVTLVEVNVAKDAKVAKDADVQGRLEESQAQVYHIDLEHADKVLSMQDDEPELAELKECFKKKKGVVIRDPEETATPLTIGHFEPKSKDKRKGILVEEPKPLKKQAQIEQDEAYAKKNMMVYLKNMAGFKMDFFKGARRRGKHGTQEKTKSSEEQEAKKQKLDEEVKKLKKYLQIVPNDEDDVYAEATPLALNFGVDAIEDFKEYKLRVYYCWLKSYDCWYKLKLLDNAVDSRLRLLEQSAVVDDKIKKYH
nr:putative ribonuclease H-like domain-containing protein [Tanacetum cinerariifolium]